MLIPFVISFRYVSHFSEIDSSEHKKKATFCSYRTNGLWTFMRLWETEKHRHIHTDDM